MRLSLFGTCFSLLVFVKGASCQLPAASSFPRNYYFSHAGNDGGDGSQQHPFASIKQCNRLKPVPGDSVFFRGGDRFPGQLRLHSAGTAARRIVFQSYGTGRAGIDAGDSSAVEIGNCSYISVSGLICTGSGRKKGNRKCGISVSYSRYIRIGDADISGFQKPGLFIYDCDSITAKNVFAHDNGAAGIEISGDGKTSFSSNILISGCRAENNPGDPTNLTNHSGNGIVAGYSRKVLIEYCSATNNGWDMPRKGNGPVGIWCFESDSVTIEHCVSYRNKTSPGGGDGGGFDFDGGVTHSLLQYNLSYENQGAGYCLFQYAGASAWHDNLVRYNISENDGQVSEAGGAVFIWNSSGEESQFYNAGFQNNSIINQRGPVISYSPFGRRKGFVFSNNIFVSGSVPLKGSTGIDVFRGNDWWSAAGLTTAPPGSRIDPGFMIPAAKKPESADTLSRFMGYTLPLSSPISSAGETMPPFPGFGWAPADFNGSIPPPRGVGAAFDPGTATDSTGAGYYRSWIVDPLSILDFHVRFTADSGAGFCFIRFFDKFHRLVHEETQSLNGAGNVAAETGIYTETPALAFSIEAGVRKADRTAKLRTDSIWLKIISGRSAAGAGVNSNFDQLMRPFWQSDTVYQEAVLMTAGETVAASGRLLFKPDRILSVEGYVPGSHYREGTDFSRRGDSLFRTTGSALPFVSDSFFDRVKNLAWYDLQSKWILVTYTHHDRFPGPVPKYAGMRLPATTRKLQLGRPLTIVAYGMSITRGMNVSGYDSVPPYMPSYVDLMTRRLSENYSHREIRLFNPALPGATIEWAARQSSLYVSPLKPDLVLIDFGMNDFWRLTPTEFGHYLGQIIDSVRKGSAQAEFLIIANMKFDPEYVLFSDPNRPFYITNMEGYAQVINSFSGNGVAVLDMTALSAVLHKAKKPRDFLSNPLHPNDYMARWYAQCLSALLIPEK